MKKELEICEYIANATQKRYDSKIRMRQEKAFNKIFAYAILDKAGLTASITGKYPSDGMGSLRVWLRIEGLPLVEGRAAGCGYNKQQAALADCMENLRELIQDTIEKESALVKTENNGGDSLVRLSLARIKAQRILESFDSDKRGDFLNAIIASGLNVETII